jgi:dTDP-L-rhamnose 4-epimerase
MTAGGKGTVLITGGAGFIGCAMSAQLVERFDTVVAVDYLTSQVHAERVRPAALHPGVELEVADITEAGTWSTLLSRVTPDVVIHLAAETGTGQSLTDSTSHTLANVVGTSRMMDGLRAASALPRRIVLSSSRAVYGEGAWKRGDGETFYPLQRTLASLGAGEWDFPDAEPLPMDARTVRPRPVSIYGVTKATQEELLRVWAASCGVEVATLRLQNVYGPGQSLTNPYTGIMSLFCRMARRGQSIPLYEDGLVLRDFVLIDDVANALVAAACAPAVASHPLDIGSGHKETIGTAAALIADYYGAPAPHVTGQFREGDVRHAWASIDAATASLPWRPQIDLATGVRLLAGWIEQQPDVPAA